MTCLSFTIAFINLLFLQVMCEDTSFDELLNYVEMNHQLACDLEAGGCGKSNHIHHILSNPPHIFTTGVTFKFSFVLVNGKKKMIEAF